MQNQAVTKGGLCTTAILKADCTKQECIFVARSALHDGHFEGRLHRICLHFVPPFSVLHDGHLEGRLHLMASHGTLLCLFSRTLI
jgi:hypothetical protein